MPVGAYAKEALENSGYYESVSRSLLLAQNTRAALMTVELGEAELGIVYKTDALKSKKVKIIAEVPSKLHKVISYSYVLCKDAKNDSRGFYDYLATKEAWGIYTKNGFRRN